MPNNEYLGNLCKVATELRNKDSDLGLIEALQNARIEIMNSSYNKQKDKYSNSDFNAQSNSKRNLNSLVS